MDLGFLVKDRSIDWLLTVSLQKGETQTVVTIGVGHDTRAEEQFLQVSLLRIGFEQLQFGEHSVRDSYCSTCYATQYGSNILVIYV